MGTCRGIKGCMRVNIIFKGLPYDTVIVLDSGDYVLQGVWSYSQGRGGGFLGLPLTITRPQPFPQAHRFASTTSTCTVAILFEVFGVLNPKRP